MAAKLLQSGADPHDEDVASQIAASISQEMFPHVELRGEEIGVVASVIATQKRVRAALLTFQRRFATAPPGPVEGAVLDGRDIGSVVLPDADVKIFVTASEEARAERRYRELLARGVPSIKSKVLQEIRERDERDCRRHLSPLVPVEGAFLLDTTRMSVDSVFEAARLFVVQESDSG